MFYLIRYYIATAALLLVTVIWGSTFPLTKILLAEMSPFYYLGVRYTITTVVMGLLFYRQLRMHWRASLKAAIPLGFAVFFAYVLQTIGLSLMTGILEEQISFHLGDFFVLLSAFCFAVQIILNARLESDSNAVCIATIQLAIVALFSFLIAYF